MAEKRAEPFHRLPGPLHGTDSGGSDNCRPARIGKLKGRHARPTPLLNVSPSPHSRPRHLKVRLTASVVFFQHNTKHPPAPLPRRNIPRYSAELPKLNLVVPGPQLPTAVSTVPPLTRWGTLPAITSKKCQSRQVKTASDAG